MNSSLHRIMAKLLLVVAGTTVAVLATLGGGAGAVPTPVGDFGVVLTSVTPDAGNNDTTYVWTLTGPAQDGLSHVLIDTCLGSTAKSSDATEGYEDPDGHGHTGYKWEAEEGDILVGTTFTIVFAGLLDDSGTADTVWAKSGDHAFGTTGGPSCDTDTTTTTSTTTSTTSTTSTTATTVATGVTPTTTVAVGGVTVQPSVQPEAETPRAAPEELAFTGAGDAVYWMSVVGAALMALGVAVLLHQRRPVAQRARRQS